VGAGTDGDQRGLEAVADFVAKLFGKRAARAKADAGAPKTKRGRTARRRAAESDSESEPEESDDDDEEEEEDNEDDEEQKKEKAGQKRKGRATPARATNSSKPAAPKAAAAKARAKAARGSSSEDEDSGGGGESGRIQRGGHSGQKRKGRSADASVSLASEPSFGASPRGGGAKGKTYGSAAAPFGKGGDAAADAVFGDARSPLSPVAKGKKGARTNDSSDEDGGAMDDDDSEDEVSWGATGRVWDRETGAFHDILGTLRRF